MPVRRFLSALAVTLATTAALLVTPTAASATTSDAADPTTWQVQPTGPDGVGTRAYYVLEADAGTTLHDMVAITNLSERDITLRVFGTDAFNAATGEFDLLPSAESPTGVGAWTRLDPATVAADGSVTVPARSRLNLPFTITVPINATPGDHVGGIVTSLPTVRTAENGDQVLVDARVAARVYLSVRGDVVPRLSVGDVRAERTGSWWNPLEGDVEVSWTVTNTGNIRLGGTQDVAVAGPFGAARVEAETITLPEILPGSSVEQRVTIPGVAATGMLTIDGLVQPIDETGRSGSIAAVSFSATLAAMPWAALGALAVLALLAWLLVRTLLRRRAGVRKMKAELAALKAGAAASPTDAPTDGAPTDGAPTDASASAPESTPTTPEPAEAPAR